MEMMNVTRIVNSGMQAGSKTADAARKDKNELDFSTCMKRVSEDSNRTGKEATANEAMPKKAVEGMKLSKKDKEQLKDMDVEDFMNMASELAGIMNMSMKELLDENSLKDMIREACKNAGCQLSEDFIGNLASKIGSIDIKDLMNASDLKSKLAAMLESVDFKGEMTQAMTEKLVNVLDCKLEEKLPENLSENLKQCLIKNCKEIASGSEDDLAAALKARMNQLAGESDENAKALSSSSVETSTDSNSSSNAGTDKPQSKEDAFLKSLAGKDEGLMTSRNSSFMMQLGQLSENKEIAENVPPVVNKNTAAMDLVKSFKFMENNGMKELTVKIMPKELGEMMIKISMEGNVMKASLTASNKEAYDLLSANLSSILDKLKNDNIKIENISLNIYGQDTTFFKGQQNENNQNGNAEHFVNGNANGKEESTSMGEVEDTMNEQEGNVNLLA